MVRENLHQVRMKRYQALVGQRILGHAGAISILTVAGFLILCITAFPQSAYRGNSSSADSFLRSSMEEELKAEADDHTHWMYQERTGVAGKEQLKLVVETRQGDIDRLSSVNGQPISAEQQKQEDRRIDRLLHKENEQEKSKHAQEEDARQTEHFFKVLPDAVTGSYGDNKGDLIEILFKPNPNFRPASHEDAVFHAMAGRIWINRKEGRLAEIEGHLIQDVRFADGLLGHLDEGGEFHVRQSEVAPGHWEITLLHVNMHGKALFFKTITVQENEDRANFQRVADNLTLAEAAQELQRHSTSTTNSAAVETHPLPTGSQNASRN